MKKIKSDKTKKKNNKLIKWFKKRLKSKKLQFNLGETIIFMLITFSFGLVLGGVVMYGKGFFGHHTTSTMNEFISTYSDIVNNYYEDVNEDELLEAGINGMLRKLGDPYTVFMSKNQADDFNESVEGIYHGIGAQIKYDDKFEHVLIGEVFENSPAEQAGLMTDDELIKVNGESIEKMSLSKISSIVKGEDGTEVELTILRDGEEKILKIKRGSVDNISVEGKVIEKDNQKIGYLAITVFAANTFDQFKKELESLEAQKIDSLIIDVRGNSGGYLTTVTDMLSMFTKKDEIIYKLKTKDKLEVIRDKTDEHRDYRIVILANSGSASASEVLTGCLKETYGAKVVGTKTFGKGKVQKLYSLSSGAVVKYTYQEWLTPEGNYIDSVGIEPDYEIKYELNKDKDNQLDKALEVITKEEW